MDGAELPFVVLLPDVPSAASPLPAIEVVPDLDSVVVELGVEVSELFCGEGDAELEGAAGALALETGVGPSELWLLG